MCQQGVAYHFAAAPKCRGHLLLHRARAAAARHASRGGTFAAGLRQNLFGSVHKCWLDRLGAEGQLVILDLDALQYCFMFLVS